jgi:hypothetical protein
MQGASASAFRNLRKIAGIKINLTIHKPAKSSRLSNKHDTE